LRARCIKIAGEVTNAVDEKEKKDLEDDLHVYKQQHKKQRKMKIKAYS